MGKGGIRGGHALLNFEKVVFTLLGWLYLYYITELNMRMTQSLFRAKFLSKLGPWL